MKKRDTKESVLLKLDELRRPRLRMLEVSIP